MDAENDAAMMFCARGGLRLELAYKRFLDVTELPPPMPSSGLMVSRVVAMRSALMRVVTEGRDVLPPAAETTLRYEFSRSSVAEVAFAITGATVDSGSAAWSEGYRPDLLARLLHHPDGANVVAALSSQADLFSRHLRASLGGRSKCVLVDTGLFGTTRQLVAEGFPDLDVSCALLARAYRPSPDRSKSFGLSVETDGYSPLRRRTALLRHWHFIEWVFEPELPSVRDFTVDGDEVRSNLEVDGWAGRVLPEAGSVFGGSLDYIESLPTGPAAKIEADAAHAWKAVKRSLVWPRPAIGRALVVGSRSHDFGSDRTWSPRSSPGALAALRGSTMWREGEVARSGSPLRLPLLAVIEAAYGLRSIKKSIVRR